MPNAVEMAEDQQYLPTRRYICLNLSTINITALGQLDSRCKSHDSTRINQSIHMDPVKRLARLKLPHNRGTKVVEIVAREQLELSSQLDHNILKVWKMLGEAQDFTFVERFFPPVTDLIPGRVDRQNEVLDSLIVIMIGGGVEAFDGRGISEMESRAISINLIRGGRCSRHC